MRPGVLRVDVDCIDVMGELSGDPAKLATEIRLQREAGRRCQPRGPARLQSSVRELSIGPVEELVAAVEQVTFDQPVGCVRRAAIEPEARLPVTDPVA